jgi:TPR repeat protein
MIKAWMTLWMAGAIVLLSCSLVSCVTNPPPHEISRLQQGKRDFDQGYYRRALQELLPLACGCHPNAQAEYGVGYMYYYGLGVAQDTDIGYFWIRCSAGHGFPPAILALHMITAGQAPNTKAGASPPNPY